MGSGFFGACSLASLPSFFSSIRSVSSRTPQDGQVFCCKTYLPLASLIKGPAAVGGNNRTREAGFQSSPARQKTCWHFAQRISAPCGPVQSSRFLLRR